MEAGAPSPDGGGKTDGGKTTPDSGTDAKTGADSSPTSAGLSALGERCSANPDCASGLECVPTEEDLGGICDLISFGVKPTGNICGGECIAASDCYELPVNNPTGLTTCGDILQNDLNGDFSTACAGQVAGSATSVACFFYKTYCQSPTTSKSWTCTANNTCAFTGQCTDAVTDDVGGCPLETRTGAGPSNGSTCDTTTMKCGVGTVVTECSTAADCNGGGLLTADTAQVCMNSDCTCAQGACYLKCANNLDCAVGLTCNTSTKVCEVAPACTVDQDCVTASGDVKSVCAKGVCSTPCTNDHDCSKSSGANALVSAPFPFGLGPFTGQVCDLTTNTCASVGCVASTAGMPSSTCPGASSGVPLFCVKPTIPAALTTLHSAITSP
jgi:hypothetical protein